MKNIFILSFFFTAFVAQSQQVAIGNWRTHLPYRDAVFVVDAGSRIYCSSTSGLFYYDRSDNSVKTLTKLDGLSDVGVTAIGYNQPTATTVIGYESGEIDLITAQKIVTLHDIKNNTFQIKKRINKITFSGAYAYLATNFGIVVLDLEKQEVRDTYFIGAGGAATDVLSVFLDENNIYAGTTTSLMYCSLNNVVADYHNWLTLKASPVGNYTDIAKLNNKLVTIYSKFNNDTIRNRDSVFFLKGATWKNLDTTLKASVYKLETSANKLLISTNHNGVVYDTAFTKTNVLDSYWLFINPRDIIQTSDDIYWIADNLGGLIKYKDTKSDFLSPNSPGFPQSFKMESVGNTIWSVAGGRKSDATNLYRQALFDKFDGNNWTSFSKFNTRGIDTAFDFTSIAIDPLNVNHILMGSWGEGLYEYTGAGDPKIFNSANSTLQKFVSGNFKQTFVGGVAFDKQNNIWCLNSRSSRPLSYRNSAGKWFSFDLDNRVTDLTPAHLLIDSYNQKWIGTIHTPEPQRPKMVVFNDNNTPEDPSDDKVKVMDIHLITGNSETNVEPQCMAQDQDGAIWVGTDHGIAVYYSPGSIFNDNQNAQQILIEQDGNAQYLLENDFVYDIAVDGGNRKWVATSRGGVFLFSPDGTQTLQHFTEDNSPLLSNEVLSVRINHDNGEVFFGTAKGVVSYKGTATGAKEDFDQVYAFPNPVPSGYDGTIGIRGLAANVNVKITDIGGHLVFETKANGGEATWSGLNLQGQKVNTGVYLVFCSNDDGSSTFVTKVAYIK